MKINELDTLTDDVVEAARLSSASPNPPTEDPRSRQTTLRVTATGGYQPMNRTPRPSGRRWSTLASNLVGFISTAESVAGATSVRHWIEHSPLRPRRLEIARNTRTKAGTCLGKRGRRRRDHRGRLHRLPPLRRGPQGRWGGAGDPCSRGRGCGRGVQAGDRPDGRRRGSACWGPCSCWPAAGSPCGGRPRGAGGVRARSVWWASGWSSGRSSSGSRRRCPTVFRSRRRAHGAGRVSRMKRETPVFPRRQSRASMRRRGR